MSACPNHIVGRVTPFKTRGYVAMAGTFGYELDITKLLEEEKHLIEEQVKMYHRFQPLVREGDYYRVASWRENHRYDCWQVVAKDKSEALITYVQVLAEPNWHSRKIRLKGLDPEAEYRLEEIEMEANHQTKVGKTTADQIYKGAFLMYGGLLLPRLTGDFMSKMIYLSDVRICR